MIVGNVSLVFFNEHILVNMWIQLLCDTNVNLVNNRQGMNLDFIDSLLPKTNKVLLSQA